MVRRLVDAHPRIAVTEELPRQSFPALTRGFKLIDRWVTQRDRHAAHWRTAKAEVMEQLWRATSGIEAADTRRIGNKTPTAEMHFEGLEEVFSKTPPQYLYCLRSPAAVMRSLVNMPWMRHSFRTALGRYKMSVRAYEGMVRTAPDRVLLCQVDRLEPGGEGLVELARSIFGFLDEPLDAELSERIAGFAPANTLERKLEGATARELGWLQRRYLALDPEVRRIRRHYGYDGEVDA